MAQKRELQAEEDRSQEISEPRSFDELHVGRKHADF